MNLLKIARKKAIPRNKINGTCGNQKEYSVYHVTTSHLDTRGLIESAIPGKKTFEGMDEMQILQDVCGN